MDYSAVISAISTVGFPIVMSCILLYMLDKNNTDHKEEQEKLVQSLNNNTLALQHLSDTLGGNVNE